MAQERERQLKAFRKKLERDKLAKSNAKSEQKACADLFGCDFNDNSDFDIEAAIEFDFVFDDSKFINVDSKISPDIHKLVEVAVEMGKRSQEIAKNIQPGSLLRETRVYGSVSKSSVEQQAAQEEGVIRKKQSVKQARRKVKRRVRAHAAFIHKKNKERARDLKDVRKSLEFISGYKGQNETKALKVVPTEKSNTKESKNIKMLQRKAARSLAKITGEKPVHRTRTTNHPNKNRMARRKAEKKTNIKSEGRTEMEEKECPYYSFLDPDPNVEPRKFRSNLCDYDTYLDYVRRFGKDHAEQLFALLEHNENTLRKKGIILEEKHVDSMVEDYCSRNFLDFAKEKVCATRDWMKNVPTDFKNFMEKIRHDLEIVLGPVIEKAKASFELFMHFFPFEKIYALAKYVRSELFSEVTTLIISFFHLVVGIFTAEGSLVRRSLAISNFVFILGLSAEKQYWSKMANFVPDDWNKIKSESLSESFDKFNIFLETVHNSEFVGAVRNLVVTAALSRFFPTVGLTAVKSLFGKIPKMSVLDMFTNILSSLSSLFKHGEKLLAGVPFNDVFLSGDSVANFIDKSQELLRYKDRLYSGCKVAGYMSKYDFQKQVYELLETGDFLIKGVTKYDYRLRV